MPKVLTIVFLAFYVYVILSSITVILLENRNPAKSLSWILVLIFLPGVGLVLYIARTTASRSSWTKTRYSTSSTAPWLRST